MNTVAVERGLDPVKSYLESQGCQVVEMGSANSNVNAAVCCITGADKNVMGMQDVVQNCPVISCDGLSPEEVYNRVKSYIQ